MVKFLMGVFGAIGLLVTSVFVWTVVWPAIIFVGATLIVIPYLLGIVLIIYIILVKGITLRRRK
jgi:hypothetical protein